METTKKYVVGGVVVAAVLAAVLFFSDAFAPDIAKATPFNCGNTLVMDVADPVWIDDNEIYFNDPHVNVPVDHRQWPQPTPGSSPPRDCVNPPLYVNIEKLNAEPGNLARWLKQHGGRICFKESYDLIECEHLFSSNDHDAIKESRVRGEITIGEIKAKFRDHGQSDISKLNYGHFVVFKLGIFGYGVSPDIETDYSPGDNCYSAAFINSIIHNRALRDESVLTFRKPRMRNEVTGQISRRLVFSIKDGNDVEHFYNFSQVPGSMTGSYSYSPI